MALSNLGACSETRIGLALWTPSHRNPPYHPPRHVSELVENVTYDEIAVGRTASLSRVLSHEDIELFARVSGDTNPAHLDAEYAAGTMFKGVIGHGIWSASIVSAVLGTCLPGPGTIYLSQDLKFRRPVRPGDKVTATDHREGEARR